jgi:class 3 adenylate cyclase
MTYDKLFVKFLAGHLLFGDTINLAARLSSSAQAGEIIIGCDTSKLAEGSPKERIKSTLDF